MSGTLQRNARSYAAIRALQDLRLSTAKDRGLRTVRRKTNRLW